MIWRTRNCQRRKLSRSAVLALGIRTISPV
jgi:hypothetical protein